MIRLIIEKLRDGGFLVLDGDGLGLPNAMCAPIFAATDIADALGFIGDKLAPVEKAFPLDCSAIKKAAYCHDRGAAHCAQVSQPGRCKRCPHDPLRDLDGLEARAAAFKGLRSGTPPRDMIGAVTADRECIAIPNEPCAVCGSLHAETYCARQTCPGTHRKLYDERPAGNGPSNAWLQG